MSLKTWMAEFYPVTAKSAAESDVSACEHSLRKWEGLTPENLARHRMESRPSDRRIVSIADGIYLDIDAETCALCQRHLENTSTCDNCPIVKSGGVSCEDAKSEYNDWRNTGDPQPMIFALKKALAWTRKRRAKQKSGPGVAR